MRAAPFLMRLSGSSLLSGGALHCSHLLNSLASSLASSFPSDAALRQQPAERRRAPLQPLPHNTLTAASFSAAPFLSVGGSAAAYSAAASRAATLSLLQLSLTAAACSAASRPAATYPLAVPRAASFSDAALSAAACSSQINWVWGTQGWRLTGTRTDNSENKAPPSGAASPRAKTTLTSNLSHASFAMA